MKGSVPCTKKQLNEKAFLAIKNKSRSKFILTLLFIHEKNAICSFENFFCILCLLRLLRFNIVLSCIFYTGRLMCRQLLDFSLFLML